MDILKRMGINILEKLVGFHNDVFLGKFNEDKIIIRISKARRRNRSEVVAEMLFLGSLKEIANIVEPFMISGASVFEENEQIISLFKYVEGQKWNELEHTDEIICKAGRQLALIHKTSSQSKLTFYRKDYKDHNDIKLFLKNYPGKEFIEEYNDVIQLIESCPKKDNYFLIHGDYLFSNIIYNKDLTIIDFDDCEYGYYQYDIAVYMFYYLLGGNPLMMNISLNKERFEMFMKGYRSIRKIDLLELKDLNPFFRLRQMKLMGTIAEYQSEDMGEWQKRFLSSSTKRIKERKEFI